MGAGCQDGPVRAVLARGLQASQDTGYSYARDVLASLQILGGCTVREWNDYGLPDPPNGDYTPTVHELWLQQVLFALYGEVRHVRVHGCSRWIRMRALLWLAGGVVSACSVVGVLYSILK